MPPSMTTVAGISGGSSKFSLMFFSVSIALATFSEISVESFFEYSRFSMSSISSRISPSASASYFSKPVSSYFNLILNSFY